VGSGTSVLAGQAIDKIRVIDVLDGGVTNWFRTRRQHKEVLIVDLSMKADRG